MTVRDLETVWSDDARTVYRLVRGELENNIFFVVDRATSTSLLIDAATSDDDVLQLVSDLRVVAVATTHGHHDHVGGVAAVSALGLPVYLGGQDHDACATATVPLRDQQRISVGESAVVAWHTPGHTPGSYSFLLEETPLIFTGDTLFPGGPGATHFPGGDFPRIMRSLREIIFGQLGDETIFWPGHGQSSTIGAQRGALEEWAERGW